ncbi:MAG TPA: nuclear transport factor 2 family protein [Terriglobales bacterium]
MEARRLGMLHLSVLDSLLADDVTIFWGDGTADDKASTLALFRSGRVSYTRLDYDNTRVRLYGQTAVVTGDARVPVQTDGNFLESLIRVSRVYALQHDRWQAGDEPGDTDAVDVKS